MKLYSINCYEINTAIGVDEKDAIKSYLHRHPELIEVEDIEDRLQATEILGHQHFSELFAILHSEKENHEADGVALLKEIELYIWSQSLPPISSSAKLDMLDILCWMEEGMTVYGPDIEFKDLIHNQFTTDELEFLA